MRTNLQPRAVPRFVIEAKRAGPKVATERRRAVLKADALNALEDGARYTNGR